MSKGFICHNLWCRGGTGTGTKRNKKPRTYHCERCHRISYCSRDCRMQDMVEHAPRCIDIRTAGPFEYFDAMNTHCPLVERFGRHSHGGPTHLYYSEDFRKFHDHLFTYAQSLPRHEKHHLSCKCATPLERCNFDNGTIMVQFVIVDHNPARYTVLVGFKCNRCASTGPGHINHVFALVALGRSAMCCIPSYYGLLPGSDAKLSLFRIINVSCPELDSPPGGCTVGVLATRIGPEGAGARLNQFTIIPSAEMHGAPLWLLVDNKWELS